MTRKALNVRLDAEDYRFLEEWAVFKGTTVSDMAREAVKAYRLEMADPVQLRAWRDEHYREAKRLEALLPEAERKVGEMREEAAQREVARLAEDPVQDALDGISQAFEASRRPYTRGENISWLTGKVEAEPALKGSVTRHVQTLAVRLGLEEGRL